MAVIPDSKLRALAEALERDGQVTFKNGAKVRFYRDGLQVRRRGGLTRTYSRSALRGAYEFALHGPGPLPPPPPKLQPPARDWGPVPF